MVSDEHMDDESLMARICEQDHQAFAVLVKRYSQMFYAAAYRMCSDDTMAEDIVQEAFLKLWKRPEAFDPDRGAKLTTWFYRVVSNLAIDKMRRLKLSLHDGEGVLDGLESDVMRADEELVMGEKQRALETAIQDLPERQRMALNLCFYEDVSNKEAAEILGVGVKALESLLMRAKKNLKDRLLPLDKEGRYG